MTTILLIEDDPTNQTYNRIHSYETWVCRELMRQTDIAGSRYSINALSLILFCLDVMLPGLEWF